MEYLIRYGCSGSHLSDIIYLQDILEYYQCRIVIILRVFLEAADRDPGGAPTPAGPAVRQHVQVARHPPPAGGYTAEEHRRE